MDAIIKQIQKSLEDGRPANIQTGPVASLIIKEIQRSAPGGQRIKALQEKENA